MLRAPLLSAFLCATVVLLTNASDSTFNVDGSEEGAIVPRTPQNRSLAGIIAETYNRSRKSAPNRNVIGNGNVKQRRLYKRGRENLRMFGKTTGMRIIEAGRGGKKGPWLKDGLKFCPRTWSTNGITVKCATAGNVHHVHFFINGHIERTEVNHPYTIAGDVRGERFPWILPYYGNMTVGCETQLHERLEYKVDFSCPKDAPPAPEEEEANPGVDTKPVGSNQPLQSTHQPSPSTTNTGSSRLSKNSRGQKQTQKPRQWYGKKNPKPSSNKQKKPNQKTTPNKPKPKPAPKKPSQKTSPNKQKQPNSSKKPNQKPKPKPKPKQPNSNKQKPAKPNSNSEPKPKGPLPFKKSYCVKMGAKGYRVVRGGLGAHSWLSTTNGMIFKPAFRGRRTFRPKQWMEYGIRVPVESNYAIVIEMTTKHWTEHNDVWLRWPQGNGFRLRRGKSSFLRGTKWTKAYHNGYGRAKKSFSVDFRPHAFSTADVLKPGKTYMLHIGGRSSQVVVHRIIMFPCSGQSCHVGSGRWQRYIREC